MQDLYRPAYEQTNRYHAETREPVILLNINEKHKIQIELIRLNTDTIYIKTIKYDWQK